MSREHFGSRNRRDGVTSRIRLRNWDYTTPGHYFITICCDGHRTRFGHIHDNAIVPTPIGTIVCEEWKRLTRAYPESSFDPICLMPNHVHAMIGLALNRAADEHAQHDLKRLVQVFKSRTALAWGRLQSGPYTPLWQSGFYDEIVWDDNGLAVLRQYMDANPSLWRSDTFFRPG